VTMWDIIRRRQRQEDAEMVASAVRQALATIRPDAGVVIIKDLHITVNMAQGGGATINVKER